jgi:MFS family permease
MSGAMMAPALSVIGKDLHIGDEQTQMSLSIFVLAFAFGPIFLAPLSEIIGRKKVWISSGCWYIIWNTVCGFANSNAVMIFARVMAGFGASAEYAVSMLLFLHS